MNIQRNENRRYSFQDYLQWDDGIRYEIIDGEPVMLAAPTTKHQGIVSFLVTEFNILLRGSSCKVYPAPFAVRFSKTDDYDHADDVYEPDISIICDRNRLDDRGYKGAPTLIVEILSPSTSKNDRVRKYNMYQLFGLKEYWIVDPLNETIEIYEWVDGSFQRWNAYGREDEISSIQFENLNMRAEEIFSY